MLKVKCYVTNHLVRLNRLRLERSVHPKDFEKKDL